MRTLNYQITRENFGESLQDMSIGKKNYSENIVEAKMRKANTNKWDYIRVRHFCTPKGTVNNEATDKTGLNICKLYIWKRIHTQDT